MDVTPAIWFSLGALVGFYAWYFFSGMAIFEQFLEKVTKRDAEKIAYYRAMAKREFEHAAKEKGEAERMRNIVKQDLLNYSERQVHMLEKAYWKAYEDYRLDLENGVPFDRTLFSDAVKALREQRKNNHSID